MKERGFIRWICETLTDCLRKLRRFPSDPALDQCLSSSPVQRLNDQALFILETSPPLPRPDALWQAQKIIIEARDRFEKGQHFQSIASQPHLTVVCGRIIERAPNLGNFIQTPYNPQEAVHLVKVFPAA